MTEEIVANIEAEQAIIAGIFMDQHRVLSILNSMGFKDDWFFDELNHALYLGCVKALGKGEKIAVQTIKEYVEPGIHVDGIGFQILKWMDSCNIGYTMHYAKIMQDKYLRRSAVNAMRAGADRILKEDDVHETIAHVRHLLHKVPGAVRADISISEMMAKAEQDAIMAKKMGYIGIKSRWRMFQKEFGGHPKGEMIIVSGRPSQGKSTLVNNEATFATVDCGIPTAILSLEMGAQTWLLRSACEMAKVDQRKYSHGLCDEFEIEAVRAATLRLAKAPLYINDRSQTIESACMWIRDIIDDKGIGLVIVDYLQALKGDSSHSKWNETQTLGYISSCVKNLTKEYPGTAFLLVASMNRAMEDRSQREASRPRMSDLRGSGQLESDADRIMFVYQDPTAGTEIIKDDAPTMVDMQKNRTGPTGVIKLTFKKTLQYFDEPKTW